jgi:hypothetical protein
MALANIFLVQFSHGKEEEEEEERRNRNKCQQLIYIVWREAND